MGSNSAFSRNILSKRHLVKKVSSSHSVSLFALSLLRCHYFIAVASIN